MEMAARRHECAAALHSLFLKYLGRTRGVQKCGATPHGSRLSRGALLLALQQPHDAVDVDGEAGPHRCRPLQVGDILRLAAPRRPRRLNVHVSRTLKAAASGKQFIPRKVAFNAHSSQNNTHRAVTPGSYPPIFIGVSRSIHIVMGV